MKKLLCAGFAVVFASAFLFAQNAAPAFSKGKKPSVDKEVKEMMELVQKYQKETSAKKKDKIEAQVREKVAANYDKHIANMEERLDEAQTRLAEAEAKLTQAKTAEGRKANIDDITQDILKGERPFMSAPKSGKWGGRGLRPDGKYGLMDKQKGPRGPHMKKGMPPCKNEDCPLMKGAPKGGPAIMKGSDMPPCMNEDCPLMKCAPKGGPAMQDGSEPEPPMEEEVTATAVKADTTKTAAKK